MKYNGIMNTKPPRIKRPCFVCGEPTRSKYRICTRYDMSCDEHQNRVKYLVNQCNVPLEEALRQVQLDLDDEDSMAEYGAAEEFDALIDDAMGIREFGT